MVRERYIFSKTEMMCSRNMVQQKYFAVKGYDSICRDREEGSGGGCIIFFKARNTIYNFGERNILGVYNNRNIDERRKYKDC